MCLHSTGVGQPYIMNSIHCQYPLFPNIISTTVSNQLFSLSMVACLLSQVQHYFLAIVNKLIILVYRPPLRITYCTNHIPTTYCTHCLYRPHTDQIQLFTITLCPYCFCNAGFARTRPCQRRPHHAASELLHKAQGRL